MLGLEDEFPLKLGYFFRVNMLIYQRVYMFYKKKLLEDRW